MTKHMKYPITTRIDIFHLSMYVFIVFVHAAESKTKIFRFGNKPQLFRTYIYKIICNISVYIQYGQISKD